MLPPKGKKKKRLDLHLPPVISELGRICERRRFLCKRVHWLIMNIIFTPGILFYFYSRIFLFTDCLLSWTDQTSLQLDDSHSCVHLPEVSLSKTFNPSCSTVTGPILHCNVFKAEGNKMSLLRLNLQIFVLYIFDKNVIWRLYTELLCTSAG